MAAIDEETLLVPISHVLFREELDLVMDEIQDILETRAYEAR